MWKILNYLLGWDYIKWENSCDSGIARVFKPADGNPFYYRYRITGKIDTIRRKEQVTWITCKSSKYIN